MVSLLSEFLSTKSATIDEKLVGSSLRFRMPSRLILSLFTAFFALPCWAFTYNISGTVSRNLDQDPTVSLTVVIKGAGDIFPTGTVDATAYKRLQIYASDYDSDQPIPLGGGDTAQVSTGYVTDLEYVEAAVPQVQKTDDNRSDLQFNLTVREKESGKLKTLVKDKKINFIAQFVRELPTKLPYKETDKSLPAAINVASYVPIEAPKMTTSGTHKSILVEWTKAEKIAYSDGNSREPGLTNVYIFEYNPGGGIVDLSAAAKTFSSETADDTSEGSCTMDPSLANGQNCLKCERLSTSKYTYLDRNASDVGTLAAFTHSPTAALAGSSVSIGGLESDKKYIVSGSYGPDGSSFSTCSLVEPVVNRTLSEINGEKDATEKDLRCFVATAVYGSPFHHHVAVLRWLRSHVIMKSTMGREFVRWYYRVGPGWAELINDRPYLKVAAQIVILPLVGVAYLIQWVSQNASLGTMVVLLGFFLGAGVLASRRIVRVRQP